jgi:hypothetical protein
MDDDQFERWLRTLSASPSRRGIVRALASLTIGGGWGFRLSGEDAGAKKRKKKRGAKKRQGTAAPPSPPPSPSPPVTCNPNCACRVCGDDGCGGSCGECEANQVCQGTTCCTPEPLVTTCAGRCGVWTNNCGQSVACYVCPGNRVCLSNGTCAIECPGASPPCNQRPGCSGCSGSSVEGPGHCVKGATVCPTQLCESTADCPPGTHCQQCPVNGPTVCAPLCT